MKQVTEQQLKQGLELFWAKGFDAVRPVEIEKAMGLSQESFDGLYGTKAVLYGKLLEFYFEHYWGHALEKLLKDQPLSAALIGFFEDEIRICLEKVAPCGNLLVIPVEGLSPSVASVEKVRMECLRKIERAFYKRLEEARKKGEIGDFADIADLSDELSRSFITIAMDAQKGVEKKVLFQLAQSTVRMVPIL